MATYYAKLSQGYFEIPADLVERLGINETTGIIMTPFKVPSDEKDQEECCIQCSRFGESTEETRTKGKIVRSNVPVKKEEETKKAGREEAVSYITAVPYYLRNEVGWEEEEKVAIVEKPDHFEIWSKGVWEKYEANINIQKDSEKLKERF